MVWSRYELPGHAVLTSRSACLPGHHRRSNPSARTSWPACRAKSRSVRKQLAVAPDLEHHIRVREQAPEQDLVGREDGAAERLLQRLDCARRSEAVAADEDCFRSI